MKLSQFHYIETECVLHGRESVNKQEVIKAYDGVRISPTYSKLYLKQMCDMFSLPESQLYADVIQTFKDSGAELAPQHIYDDVQAVLTHLHGSGFLHDMIMDDPARHLLHNPNLYPYLKRLKDNDKRIFLLSNSPYKFIDVGIRHALANCGAPQDVVDNWVCLFDFVICSSRKPDWFTSNTPFRKIDRKTGMPVFEKVTSFKEGEVYAEGCLSLFEEFSGVSGSEVLYAGDHVFSDLSRPNKFANWRTCAIIKELEHEIDVQSSPEFRDQLMEMQNVQALINLGQQLFDEESMAHVKLMKARRNLLRTNLKCLQNVQVCVYVCVCVCECVCVHIFMYLHYTTPNCTTLYHSNPLRSIFCHILTQFGSVFRTAEFRTQFFSEVSFYADLYTASLDSLASYDLTHCFYAQRSIMPHDLYDQRNFKRKPEGLIN
jgi:HAD superfamily 5'-nucleotidase-like hydrolase